VKEKEEKKEPRSFLSFPCTAADPRKGRNPRGKKKKKNCELANPCRGLPGEKNLKKKKRKKSLNVSSKSPEEKGGERGGEPWFHPNFVANSAA